MVYNKTMKISIPKKSRKYILIYLVVLLALYLVIVLVPKVTDIFETTETLEPGNLALSCEGTGYLIKREAIATADRAGAIDYRYKEGAVVGRDWKILTIDSGEAIQETGSGNVSSAFASQMNELKGFDRVVETNRSPISGVYSTSFDGNEKYFSPENMDSITREEAENRSLRKKSLSRSNTTAGDPLFKITNDGKWYIVCWLKEKERENFDEGQEVSLNLPNGDVQGKIESIKKEDKKRYRLIISSNWGYERLAETRKVDLTISGKDVTGLLIDNGCIVRKNGKQGVYVRDKNGDYSFTPIQVISTDGSHSVVTGSRFYDEKGKTVLTVSVYDEILKNPKGQLKRDLKEEQKQKEKKQKQ